MFVCVQISLWGDFSPSKIVAFVFLFFFQFSSSITSTWSFLEDEHHKLLTVLPQCFCLIICHAQSPGLSDKLGELSFLISHLIPRKTPNFT